MLEGILRESTGKKATKKLRRNGYLIANIYGKGFENINAAFDENEFIRYAKNKTTLAFDVKVGEVITKVVIQDYQRDPLTNRLKHIDLKAVLPNVLSKYMVPVVTVGIPKGLKNKGVLITSKKRLKVKCTAENLPNSFELDVSDLDLGDSILVRDIKIPENVTMMEAGRVAITDVIKAK